MTLQHLYDKIGSQLRICPRKGEDVVGIELPSSGFEGSLVVGVKDAYCGIDWDDGKFIMVPEKDLRVDKTYYPMGTEPVEHRCLTCDLQCPTDCPMDKEEK